MHTTTWSCPVSAPTGCNHHFRVHCLLSFYVQHSLSLFLPKSYHHNTSYLGPLSYAVLTETVTVYPFSINTVYPFNAAICKVCVCAMSHKSSKPAYHSSSLFFSTSDCFACFPYFPIFFK